jgi:hypothetical protein
VSRSAGALSAAAAPPSAASCGTPVRGALAALWTAVARTAPSTFGAWRQHEQRGGPQRRDRSFVAPRVRAHRSAQQQQARVRRTVPAQTHDAPCVGGRHCIVSTCGVGATGWKRQPALRLRRSPVAAVRHEPPCEPASGRPAASALAATIERQRARSPRIPRRGRTLWRPRHRVVRLPLCSVLQATHALQSTDGEVDVASVSTSLLSTHLTPSAGHDLTFAVLCHSRTRSRPHLVLEGATRVHCSGSTLLTSRRLTCPPSFTVRHRTWDRRESTCEPM